MTSRILTQMTVHESNEEFLDTSIDLAHALPPFAETFDIPAGTATHVIYTLAREGLVTVQEDPETDDRLFLTTPRQLRIIANFWTDNPQRKPIHIGPKKITLLRAFCGEEPAISNLNRLKRNKNEEMEELTKLPLDFILLDTVIINDEPHELVTGKAIRRYISKELPDQKKIRVNRIVERIGEILTPHWQPDNSNKINAPAMVADGVAYIQTTRHGRANDWGIAPSIFHSDIHY